MYDRIYTSYIPDLTERFPDGFRSFDDPCDYDYEPSYDELVEMGEYEDVTEDDQEDNYINGIFESMDIILNE
mgnify:CR=1 FL=1